MKRYISASSLVVLFTSVIITLNTGCAGRLLGKPSGKSVASCKGKIELTSGEKTRFTFDVYRKADGEFKAYLTMPRKWIRYKSVEDISFENGVIRIKVGSPERVYEGRLIGDSLTVTGEWNEYRGTLNLKIDN